jgi:hypothetical protein
MQTKFVQEHILCMMPSHGAGGLHVTFGVQLPDGSWTRRSVQPKLFEDNVEFHLKNTLGVREEDIPEMRAALEEDRNVVFKTHCAYDDLVSLGYFEE